MYAQGSTVALFVGSFSWERLDNAALDAFLVTFAVVFISAGANRIKKA